MPSRGTATLLSFSYRMQMHSSAQLDQLEELRASYTNTTPPLRSPATPTKNGASTATCRNCAPASKASANSRKQTPVILERSSARALRSRRTAVPYHLYRSCGHRYAACTCVPAEARTLRVPQARQTHSPARKRWVNRSTRQSPLQRTAPAEFVILSEESADPMRIRSRRILRSARGKLSWCEPLTTLAVGAEGPLRVTGIKDPHHRPCDPGTYIVRMWGRFPSQQFDL